MYAGRTPPEEPPCDTCRVDLMPENQEAAEVYQVVRGQVITAGMDGRVIDLNFPAVKIVMDLNGVKDQKACFDKVRHTFYELLREARERAETSDG